MTNNLTNKMLMKRNKKEHQDLIKRLEKIDPAAAQWVRDEMPTHRAFRSFGRCVNSSMLWAATPQGWDYWNDINGKERRMAREERDAEGAGT